ncbi:MAG: hypothetical protein KatS3mg053_0934 [Candidatus Roseilinea sp.]|jgi:AbrB family looped-hinge helix DNA binding protein|nr:MAG: hypothetical protein KatS3mg053_0934 [Candidatus Roseilinea sp.]
MMTVQVSQRGVITLPKALRDAYRVKEGDVFTVIDLGGGAFALVPRQLTVDRLANSIREGLAAKGETLESMLKRLRAARERNGKAGT